MHEDPRGLGGPLETIRQSLKAVRTARYPGLVIMGVTYWAAQHPCWRASVALTPAPELELPAKSMKSVA
jgi:hypothetical protein